MFASIQESILFSPSWKLRFIDRGCIPMPQFRLARFGGCFLAASFASLTLLSGCSSDEAVQTAPSKEITQQKLQEMQKGMMGTVPAKGKTSK